MIPQKFLTYYLAKYVAMNEPLPQQVKNLNEAYANQFKLVLNDIRETTFECQVGSLPGVSQANIRLPNVNNYINVHASKLDYDPLTITFKVDEDLNNYLEIYSWLIGITAPQQFEQFQFFQSRHNFYKKNGYVTALDASLIQLTQAYNPNVEIVYVNLQPVSLGSLDFDLKMNEIITASASFVYDYFYFRNRQDKNKNVLP